MRGTGIHYATMAIMAALVYRTVSGKGQYIDISIHEACALTTDGIPTYVYRGETLIRLYCAYRSGLSNATCRSILRSEIWHRRDARLISGGLNPRNVKNSSQTSRPLVHGRSSARSDNDDPAVGYGQRIAYHRRSPRQLRAARPRTKSTTPARTGAPPGCGPRA